MPEKFRLIKANKRPAPERPVWQSVRFTDDFATRIDGLVPGYPYFSIDQLVPATQRLLGGQVIQWDSDEAITQLRGQTDTPLSQHSRAFNTAVAIPSAESDQFFHMIADHLNNFAREGNVLTSPSARQQLIFIYLAGSGLHILEYERKRTPASEAFVATIKYHTSRVASGIGSATPAHITRFLPLLDTFIELTQKRNIPKGVQKEIDLQAKKGEVKQTMQLGLDTNAAFANGWQKAKAGWSWKHIGEVIALLPTFRTTTARLHAFAALEENLVEIFQKSDGYPDEFSIDPEGAIELLKFRWAAASAEDVAQTKDLYRDNYQTVGLQLGNPAMPIERLPSVAMQLFYLLPEVQDTEAFLQTIQAIGGLARQDPNLTTNWAIVLLGIRQKFPYLNGRIDEELAALDSLHPKVKAAALNEEPGKVWLRGNRLHVSGPEAQYQGAFLVYQSSAVAVSAPAEPKPEAPKPIQKQSETRRIVDEEIEIPGLGRVGLVKSGVDGLLAPRTAKNPHLLNQDTLATDFRELQYRFRHDRNYRDHSLFLPDLYHSDRMRAARQLGIEAVHVDVSLPHRLRFILDPKLLPKSTQTLVAFQADLFQGGVLLSNAIALEHPLRAFLNNLALELAMRTHRQLDTAYWYDKQLEGMFLERIKHFNQTGAPYYPKLDSAPGRLDIPISLEHGITVAASARLK